HHGSNTKINGSLSFFGHFGMHNCLYFSLFKQLRMNLNNLRTFQKLMPYVIYNDINQTLGGESTCLSST
ncbi:hypothetical protein, partial [Staphylococcus pseudintermedius]|uniref:hypothetical protein n=1 Tax=Staphylococcus pseudintermedius TaxID=283734 RepID=UPI001A9077C4